MLAGSATDIAASEGSDSNPGSGVPNPVSKETGAIGVSIAVGAEPSSAAASAIGIATSIATGG